MISSVPVYASFQRGQYQLKCIKLNKYQPVELFELLDAATGKRANRSAAGKAKDDDRNLFRNAQVSPLTILFTHLLHYYSKGRGDFSFFLWGYSKSYFTLFFWGLLTIGICKEKS